LDVELLTLGLDGLESMYETLIARWSIMPLVPVLMSIEAVMLCSVDIQVERGFWDTPPAGIKGTGSYERCMHTLPN
jgi:hypothetical protein